MMQVQNDLDKDTDLLPSATGYASEKYSSASSLATTTIPVDITQNTANSVQTLHTLYGPQP